ncbi:MAG: ABC-type transport system permease component LolE [Candidatus Taylorbacteria bacterium]|nr:ABC-type transport system permease component LolE [Candidatus Taylorbacteria bacterium]
MLDHIKIGFFLANRQVRRASKWTTGLIIFVMVLTFLNLTVVSGVLVGLIESSIKAQRQYYTSDVLLSTPDKKEYIENTSNIIEMIKSLPEMQMYSPRYSESGTIEANFKENTKATDKEMSGVVFTGIDPDVENKLTGISKFIIEGSYLNADDFDQVLIGSLFVKKYSPVEAAGFTALNVKAGDKIRITVNGISREMTVKGIVKSKVNEVSTRVYLPEKQFRGLIGRDDYNVDDIAIKLKDGADPLVVKEALIRAGAGDYAKIQTYEDAQPKFLKDIKDTFALLGNMISSIGLVVASITIFIVIFINAITRRKFIGIMKGIGIHGNVIEISYVFQSMFYAICGSFIGLLILYGFLIPFIDAHPIDFPFSDGILVATVSGTGIRIGLLIFATLIAGYIPARMIVRKNTLDAILGR